MDSISVVNPVSGEVIHTLEPYSATDVALEFVEAKKLQPSWNAIGAKARARIAAKYADLVIENQNSLMDQLQLETGKSRSHAFEEITGGLADVITDGEEADGPNADQIAISKEFDKIAKPTFIAMREMLDGKIERRLEATPAE